MSAPARRRHAAGARPARRSGPRPVPDQQPGAAPSRPRRRWPAWLSLAALPALALTVSQHLTFAGRGIPGAIAAWAGLTSLLLAAGWAVRRWHRPVRRTAWRGVRRGIGAGWQRIRHRPAAAPGQPPPLPGPGPWQVQLTSKSGRELIAGHSTVVATFADPDEVLAELDRRAADPDLEVDLRAAPPPAPVPPPGPVPPPTPAAPPQPAAPPGPLAGPGRPTGSAGKRAHRRSGGLRIAAGAGGVTTAEWQALVTATADFEAEDDGEFLDWSAAQVIGQASYAEALIEVFEHLTLVIGVDPAALQGMLEFADIEAEAADRMSRARQELADFYRELREAAADGRPAPRYKGDWVQGRGEV